MSQAVSERSHFERSVMAHRASLHRSALRMARSHADADDLVQETVLRAWRFWPRYTERDSSRAWLQRILRNTFLSRCRRTARERDVMSLVTRAQDDAPELEPRIETTPASDPSLDDDLTRALDGLRTEQRAVLWLVDVQERSYREVAAELGLPIGTVMSRLHRARAALRGAFPRPAAAHALPAQHAA